MHIFERAVGSALGTVAVLTGSLAVAGPAHAETAAEVCGSGYSIIDKHDLGLATIYLLYNGTTNCVVTQKAAHVGDKTFVSAFLKKAAADTVPSNTDAGKFQYYAGPVRVKAPGECIAWGGAAGPGDDPTQIWVSKASHCD